MFPHRPVTHTERTGRPISLSTAGFSFSLMDIELEGGNAIIALILILILALFLFGAVGKFVTPVDAAGNPSTLSPARWTSYKLQKQARKETKRLVRDAQRVQSILESDTPDPVEAMLVAQDIYADYQTGSSATAAARGSLILAAEATVRATIGEIERDEAVAAYNAAMQRIKALSTVGESKKSAPASPTPPQSSILYYPYFLTP